MDRGILNFIIMKRIVTVDKKYTGSRKFTVNRLIDIFLPLWLSI